MEKVLLLNPPGQHRFIRDYYCSHISKGRYYWPSLDLLVLSGVLKNHFKMYVLDAIAEGVGYDDALQRIEHIHPDFIICVTGAVSWDADMRFLSQIKEKLHLSVILSGDYPRAQSMEIIKKYCFVDAILLDFTDTEVVSFIHGEKLKYLRNILTKFDDIKSIPSEMRTTAGEKFSIPVPQHALFPLKKYHLPHLRCHPFATLMTDFGCPFHCTFCSFERMRYKIRDMNNVVEELEYLIALGIEELWLRDQSFGSAREHALDFCAALENTGHRFSWSCEMRVDAADEDLLERMKQRGCHTVMFGVETGNEDVLASHKKGITVNQVKQSFASAKKVGLRTLAHFILGLSGESAKSQVELINFCLSLNPDYASFNVAAPLWNTSFRDDAVRNRWLMNEGIEVDNSCSYPIWETSCLKRSEVWQIRKLALRKFYLRPSYILRQIKNIRTGYQLSMLWREGLHLLSSL